MAVMTALALVLTLGSGVALAAGTTRYVAPGGSDTTNCASAAHPCKTIQYAVGQAAAGNTISLAKGTYTEAGQIVIGKNLSIVGKNRANTIIRPAQDTSPAYYDDSSAWILVNAGVTFNLRGVTLNGNGRLIANAIISHGLGIIEGDNFTNIAYNQSGPDYSGAGIALYGANMTVRNNLFSDIGREGVFAAFFSVATITGNDYAGKGDGNWLDYAIEIGHNSTATITGNTISADTGVATVDGSTSAGIIVHSYYDVTGVSSGATITGNWITDNTDGIAVGILADDASVVVAHWNDLSGNSRYGAMTTSTSTTVDATCNWWGSASGPGPVGPGTGTGVSAGVTFHPWLASSNLHRGKCH
jgi:hypothetical protein